MYFIVFLKVFVVSGIGIFKKDLNLRLLFYIFYNFFYYSVILVVWGKIFVYV